jgi:hypothetical protein
VCSTCTYGRAVIVLGIQVLRVFTAPQRLSGGKVKYQVRITLAGREVEWIVVKVMYCCISPDIIVFRIATMYTSI